MCTPVHRVIDIKKKAHETRWHVCKKLIEMTILIENKKYNNPWHVNS